MLLALCDHPDDMRSALSGVFSRCTIHANLAQLIIHSQDRVISRDRRRIGQDLRRIAHPETIPQAHRAVLQLVERWRESYPQIAHSWQRQWPELADGFAYAPEIRRILCTVHSQRVLNRQFARVAGRNQQFASRLQLQRTAYLAIANSMRKWTMPVQRWNLALAQLLTQFPNRIDHLAAM